MVTVKLESIKPLNSQNQVCHLNLYSNWKFNSFNKDKEFKYQDLIIEYLVVIFNFFID